MVISTTDGLAPESAFVGFASTSDLVVIFGTKTNTRKYKNIHNNPNVALVFDDDKKTTVQYEGTASVLNGEELVRYKEIYFLKTPTSKKYEHQPLQIYLKVTPKWIRYTDYSTHSDEILEITF